MKIIHPKPLCVDERQIKCDKKQKVKKKVKFNNCKERKKFYEQNAFINSDNLFSFSKNSSKIHSHHPNKILCISTNVIYTLLK